jgi:hypothetical protein
MGIKKDFVRSQVQIQVRPPEGFSIEGDSKVKVDKVEVNESEEVGKIISDLVDYLYIQDEQNKKLKGLLGRLKKLYPCENCG